MKGADPEAQQIYAQWEVLQLEDGILYRNFLNIDAGQGYEDGLLEAMEGRRGDVLSTVCVFCRRCVQCNRFRRCPGARQGTSHPGGPFTKIHLDLTGPHVCSKNGFTYLLTAIDYFIKYLICVPIKDKTALSVAKALVRHIYCSAAKSSKSATWAGNFKMTS